MRFLIPYLITLPCLLSAEPLDGTNSPWITTGDDMVWDAVGYEMTDIIAMADLDGDPSVITPDEQAMIDLLSQVLGAAPILDQSGS